MKILSTLFLLLSIASPALALAQQIETTGKIFYLKEGKIVERDATLSVPSRGQGKVQLRTENVTLTAHSFTSRKANGSTIFYVLFKNIPMGGGENTEMALKGTYLRGENKAVYYGDIFKRTGTFTDPQEGWFHGGGFSFSSKTKP